MRDLGLLDLASGSHAVGHENEEIEGLGAGFLVDFLAGENHLAEHGRDEVEVGGREVFDYCGDGGEAITAGGGGH